MVMNMGLNPKLLWVSNQQNTLPLGAFGSTLQRFQILLEPHAAKTVQRWNEETPDLIIFDSEGMEALGLDVIRQLREQAIVPILWLASSSAERSMLEAYEAGVDEYILKPILPSLLQAKIKAWLRRTWSIPVDMLDPLRVGRVQFVPSERTIVFNGRDPIHLTNLELRLMYYLMSHPERTLTTEELCQRGWGGQGEENRTALKNVVYRLRQKIEKDPDNPRYIRTVTGVGYQFIPE